MEQRASTKGQRLVCGHLVAKNRTHFCTGRPKHTWTGIVTRPDDEMEPSWDLAWAPPSAWVHPPQPGLLRSLRERFR